MLFISLYDSRTHHNILVVQDDLVGYDDSIRMTSLSTSPMSRGQSSAIVYVVINSRVARNGGDFSRNGISINSRGRDRSCIRDSSFLFTHYRFKRYVVL
jgi:hypothetical protein